ncbi:DUF6090 family protein [Hanstruepera neustonica]|nr:DUF6090 family protein [Hanstruepera neustonica]
MGKYLKYAIGEIVLVVIGILIALQINNWNENRKVKVREAQIYNELKNDLLQTKSDIEETIAKHKKVIKVNQELIFAIHDKKPYSQTIYNLFTESSDDFQIIPKTSAFENLKNMGLNTLSNDSLRIAITNLFQLDLKRLENELEMKDTNFDFRKSLYPFQDKYLFADTTDTMHLGFKHTDTIMVYKLKVKNYEQFLNDNDLLKTLQVILFTRSLKVNEEVKTIEKIDAVIKRINDELKVNHN